MSSNEQLVLPISQAIKVAPKVPKRLSRLSRGSKTSSDFSHLYPIQYKDLVSSEIKQSLHDTNESQNFHFTSYELYGGLKLQTSSPQRVREQKYRIYNKKHAPSNSSFYDTVPYNDYLESQKTTTSINQNLSNGLLSVKRVTEVQDFPPPSRGFTGNSLKRRPIKQKQQQSETPKNFTELLIQGNRDLLNLMDQSSVTLTRPDTQINHEKQTSIISLASLMDHARLQNIDRQLDT